MKKLYSVWVIIRSMLNLKVRLNVINKLSKYCLVLKLSFVFVIHFCYQVD